MCCGAFGRSAGVALRPGNRAQHVGVLTPTLVVFPPLPIPRFRCPHLCGLKVIITYFKWTCRMWHQNQGIPPPLFPSHPSRILPDYAVQIFLLLQPLQPLIFLFLCTYTNPPPPRRSPRRTLVAVSVHELQMSHPPPPPRVLPYVGVVRRGLPAESMQIQGSCLVTRSKLHFGPAQPLMGSLRWMLTTPPSALSWKPAVLFLASLFFLWQETPCETHTAWP